MGTQIMTWWGWLLVIALGYGLVLAGAWALLVAAHGEPKGPREE